MEKKKLKKITLQVRSWFRFTEWLRSIPDKPGSGVISKTWLHEFVLTTSHTPSVSRSSNVQLPSLVTFFFGGLSHPNSPLW
jgi:hypothetical protein